MTQHSEDALREALERTKTRFNSEDYEALEDAIAELMDTRRLRKYAWHLSECPMLNTGRSAGNTMITVRPDCTCGLTS